VTGSPRGWLGIVIQGAAQEPRVVNGEMIIHYLTHPEIVSVEPSSPAERAGLVPSDTLIAYDGRDVKDGDISMTRLLRPNSRVLVRIRRDGRTRDVPVTIADVPSRISLRRDYVVEMRTSEPGAFVEAPAQPLAVEQAGEPVVLGHATELLRFRLGGLHLLVEDQIGCEVPEHRPAVAGISAELAASVQVSHRADS